MDLLRGTVLAHAVDGAADRPAHLDRRPDLHGHVVGGLHDRGFDVLVHLRPSDGDAVAAKVLVPGCEVETMSYGRIGERGVRRLRDRDDPLVAVGADPGG